MIIIYWISNDIPLLVIVAKLHDENPELTPNTMQKVTKFGNIASRKYACMACATPGKNELVDMHTYIFLDQCSDQHVWRWGSLGHN